MKIAPSNRGFSLIEVLVAAAVITLSLVAVVAFVRKGQETIALQKHRAMARGIIQQQLEKPPFQPDYYNTLTTITAPAAINVIIDSEITPNIVGQLTISISGETTQITGGVTNNDAPHRVITGTVIWTEVDGNKDTVSITKWLADVQRD
jgi:prepilin-type N-terminal cleavage/methylation domain-containing protein